jgi:hypothetical protein
MLVSYADGSVLRSVRYIVSVIPLTIILCGCAASRFPTNAIQPRFESLLRVAVVFPAAIGCLLGVWIATGALASRSVNPADYRSFVALETKFSGHPLSSEEAPVFQRFVTERQISEYLDARNLAPGSVLVDDFHGFPVVLASRNPKQFIITSDRDFPQAVADPVGSGIRYLLVPDESHQQITLDALNRTYPSLYASGAGIGRLVEYFPSSADAGPDWKLYSVVNQ